MLCTPDSPTGCVLSYSIAAAAAAATSVAAASSSHLLPATNRQPLNCINNTTRRTVTRAMPPGAASVTRAYSAAGATSTRTPFTTYAPHLPTFPAALRVTLQRAQALAADPAFCFGRGTKGDFVRILPRMNDLPAGADAAAHAAASECNSAGDSASECTGFDAQEHEPLHVLQLIQVQVWQCFTGQQ